MWNSGSEDIFLNALLKFIWSAASKTYSINGPTELKLLKIAKIDL